MLGRIFYQMLPLGEGHSFLFLSFKAEFMLIGKKLWGGIYAVAGETSWDKSSCRWRKILSQDFMLLLKSLGAKFCC
jgi:hypothetical protein